MKQTGKKIISLLFVMLCVFSMTACGPEKESTRNADIESSAQQNALGLVQTIVELTDSDIENYMISGDEFTENAMEAWSGVTEELGEFSEIQESEITTEYDETGKTYAVTVPAKFENADSNFIFEFDKTGAPETLSIEVEYSKSETLQKAALNTVIGLVIVFVMLAFLSFVISLLKYVPGLVGSFGKKKTAESKPEEAEKTVALAPGEEETVQMDVSDDSELIAVIAAAIAAAEGTSTDGFQVRSIRRVKRKKW